jgi:hypothetical protein
MRVAAVACAALVVTSVAEAAKIDRHEFRYVRTVRITSDPGRVAVSVAADGPLFAHAGPGFGTLRVVDGDGDQVPWRLLPPERPAPPERPLLLNSGRQRRTAVALLDLGPRPGIRDRLDLDLPGRGFVGRVTVSGSSDRRAFTRLSTTTVYDLEGAEGRARSTVVIFPPTDFRYLQLRATGIVRIAGATASGRPQRPAVRPVAARTRVEQGDRTTRVVLDLGYRNVPVDELRLTASEARYDRPLTVEARNGRDGWRTVAGGRAYRYYGRASPPLDLAAPARYLRVTVRNGDDAPLRGLRVQPLARPRTLLLERGGPRPIRLYYGGRSRPAPDYEFARLPGVPADRRARLAPERLTAAYEPPPDTRSFAKKHAFIVDAALALAAAVIAAGGFLALRRRA